MKKTGIITDYHNSYNYGGLLQSIALQKKIEAISERKTEQINFCRLNDLKSTDILKKMQVQKWRLIKTIISRIKDSNLQKKVENSVIDRKTKIKCFRNGIPHTEVYSINNIRKSKDVFDIFICGSDQIWNPSWYKTAYFLDFVSDEKPKIAYAASIGKSHLTPEQIDFMKPLINRLDYISVRENEAKELIKPFVEKEVKVVLDPTLLLTKDEWNEVAKDVEISGPYIFVYLLGNSKENRQQIKEVSQILGYKIAAIPHVHLRYEKADSGFADIECNDVGPAEFVGLIKKAEMVITDSFHGCVFSIIYQKKFWAVKRHQDNEKGEMNSRLYSLFENLKVGDRILKEEDIKKTKLLETIDYTVVQEALEEKKKESLDFLEEALGVK